MDTFYAPCRLCLHECGVDRLAGEIGRCGEGADLRLAVAGLHFGEEPPLTGTGGSGTIFLTGCAMDCPFCQNHQISRGGLGRVVDEAEFVAICRALEAAGAENINLVTPSHMAPTLVRYLEAVRHAGIFLPVAWNSSGFETPATVELAANHVDIWLPDLKTLDPDVAGRRYGLPGYPDAARAALSAMASLGKMEIDDKGRFRRGTMVRHLVLPGEIESTRQVLGWFADNLSGRAWLSVMTQYTPVSVPGERRLIPERQIRRREYDTILRWLDEYGIDDGFIQDTVPGSDWLPDFQRPNPFGSELSRIIWRGEAGFLL